MIETTLAKRYARALVDIGKEKDALDAYGRDLASLKDLMETSKDFRNILINPGFSMEDKKSIAGRILGKMQADPMVRNFVFLLIDRKRIDQLAGIESTYRQLVDDVRGITRAKVSSAVALTEAQLAEITGALSKISGKQVIVTAEADPSYIGGLVAKLGDMVYDGTIRTQLNQLKQSLKG